jgi:hypothetical protein
VEANECSQEGKPLLITLSACSPSLGTGNQAKETNCRLKSELKKAKRGSDIFPCV